MKILFEELHGYLQFFLASTIFYRLSLLFIVHPKELTCKSVQNTSVRLKK